MKERTRSCARSRQKGCASTSPSCPASISRRRPSSPNSRAAPSTARSTRSSPSRSARCAISRPRRAGNDFDIRAEVHDGVLRMMVPRERATVSAPDIFILWMVGSSLILLGVAVLFLRNQVRPIERLARAADALRQGPRRAGLQALRRDRGAPRGRGVPADARAPRPLPAAAHRDARGRQPRSQDSPYAYPFAARTAQAQPRHRRDARRRHANGNHAERVSGFRARRSR